MRVEEIARSLRTLGDPLRLRILRLLVVSEDLEVNELVRALRRPQPTISRQLGILREAGWVERRVDGLRRRYRLARTPNRLESALLESLAPFVASSPEAEADEGVLIGSEEYETITFHELETDDAAETEADDRVFSALRHPARRRILDLLRRNPGGTVAALVPEFQMTRAAVTRHVEVLEAAQLVHSIRRGRERRLYANPVPIQAVYDRWTDEFSAPMAHHMAGIKLAAESAP